jgi:hypothetical protein
MQLGALGEDWTDLPGMTAPAPPLPGGKAFTLPVLIMLTNSLVPDKGVEGGLIALLNRAQTAQAAGDTASMQQALNSFVLALRGETVNYATGQPVLVGYLNALALVDYAMVVQ